METQTQKPSMLSQRGPSYGSSITVFFSKGGNELEPSELQAQKQEKSSLF